MKLGIFQFVKHFKNLYCTYLKKTTFENEFLNYIELTT